MKEKIREEMLEKRESHHSAGGHSHCLEIMDRFLRLPQFNSAKCILLYASKGGEVHTDGIMRSALSLGKKVALPVTLKEEGHLELYEAKSVEELAPGAFGIMEPKRDPARRVDPGEVDLAVVPGVSFDRRGHRIGYGMGYYDSILWKIRGVRVGLAYDMQLVEHVPDEPHDVAADIIVTEKEVIGCKSQATAAKKEGDAGKMAPQDGFGGKSGGGCVKKIRVAVLASGRGSDFQSIIDGVKQGRVAAEIVALLTDNPEAGAIQRARESGIPSFIIEYGSREELDAGILARLKELAPDLVVLAGYMKIIRSKELLAAYSGRMINIHPSLLPKYPGAHAQEDAFEAGERISGYTIHFVDDSLDGGLIIHQEKVDISACKSAEEAAARILEREHAGLPMVVDRFARGEFRVNNGKVSYEQRL